MPTVICGSKLNKMRPDHPWHMPTLQTFSTAINRTEDHKLQSVPACFKKENMNQTPCISAEYKAIIL